MPVQVPGPSPASVLSAILRQDPVRPYNAADTRQRRYAWFSAGPARPFLPSLVSEQVFMPQNAYLDANVQASGYLSTQGLTGALAASRWVGATTAGAPVAGTFVTGDWVTDQSGAIWVCTAGGSPGTWTSPGGLANPMNTAGDLIVGGSGGAPARLAKGTSGQVLGVSGAGTVGWLSLSVTPSTDSSGVTDTANITAAMNALAGGGIVTLGPGTFYVTGLTVPAQTTAGTTGGGPVSIQGSGGSATIISMVGGGTCVSYHRTSGYGSQGGLTDVADLAVGFLRDFTIDGTNATAGAIGLDAGDGWGYDIDLQVSNFTAANAIAASLVNRVFWTEKGRFRLRLMNNTVAAVIDVAAAIQNSHEYDEFDIYMFCKSWQQGVEVRGGSNLGGVRLNLHGNMGSGTTTPTSATATMGAFAFTATNASPCVFTAATTALVNGTPVFLTGGSLPTGFNATTMYYVVSASGTTFQLAATRGGTGIGSTSTGSGTVTTAFAALSFVGQQSGTYSRLYESELMMKVEGNPGLGDSTIWPAGIAFDPSGSCAVKMSHGVITHSLSNSILNGSEFTFRGEIAADTALSGVTTPALTLGTAVNNLGPDALACVAGSGVTGVSVNGTATGLTGGAFFLPAGGAITVNGAAPASWTWVPASRTSV